MSKRDWFKRLQTSLPEEYTANEAIIPAQRTSLCKDAASLTLLNANENLVISRQYLTNILKDIADEIDVRTYPRIEETRLIQALADYHDLPTDYFVINNGSDPLIESCVKAFLKDRTEEAISISPTFSMYRIITQNEGHPFVEVPLDPDFSLNVDRLFEKVGDTTHLCFINSPNNPTGNQFRIQDLQKLITEFNGVVVIDEAYVEFAPYSISTFVQDFDNLVVLRTFSKVFGLAGMRIGYSIANSQVTSILRSVQLPYNINKVSLTMARKMLARRELIKGVTQQIKDERDNLYEKMNIIPEIKAFQSDTNFIFFKTNIESSEIYYGLQEQGILVRRFSNILGNHGYFRVTVGQPSMNAKFLNSLKRLCET